MSKIKIKYLYISRLYTVNFIFPPTRAVKLFSFSQMNFGPCQVCIVKIICYFSHFSQ